MLAALKQLTDEPFGFPVNATTREPRPGERDGVDYYFLTPELFARRLADGDFLEHANVYGQQKGVLKQLVRKLIESEQDVILRTDVQGARYIKKLIPETVTIFIAPPSESELERRMLARGGDSDEQVRVRLETARQELAGAKEFDHRVVNDDLDRAVQEILSIIKGERSQQGRKPTVIR